MELNDFKEAWKKTEHKKNLNIDIMKMLQHKSYGPVADLKKEFRKQIIVMALLPLFLIFTVAGDYAYCIYKYIVLGLCCFLFGSYHLCFL